MARLAHAPEPIGAQLEAERTRRENRGNVLLAVLRRLLRPRIGGRVVATSLRRMLRLAGLDPTAAELAGAVLVVGGRYSRVAPSKKGKDWRRAFVDVDLRAEQIFQVASVVGKDWEARLRSEGMPPEPTTSRHSKGMSEDEEARHLAARAAIADGKETALSAYLELRGHEIDPADRAILDLYVRHVSERDIAARLGVTHDTVRWCTAKHRTRAGLGLSPRLRRAKKYLETHDWGSDPAPERSIWERFSGGDGYRTIARELRIEWRVVVATLHKHRIRAGIALE